jgi:hypothetical protein
MGAHSTGVLQRNSKGRICANGGKSCELTVDKYLVTACFAFEIGCLLIHTVAGAILRMWRQPLRPILSYLIDELHIFCISPVYTAYVAGNDIRQRADIHL